MRSFSIVGFILIVVAIVFPASAVAQTVDPGKPVLHVNDAYSNCFFELHRDLTPQDFEEFAREIGSIMRFRQLGGTEPLGRGKVDISLQYSATPVDDSKGAWNNTMSHPAADHYLGDAIMLPRLTARFGLNDRTDLGVWGTVAQHSNYGIVGVDTKILLVQQGPSRPV